ncbi:cytochrome P450 [Xylariales sp. AK1849]|nr:cytochrome P450 [Xylariales sp. AK1849]
MATRHDVWANVLTKLRAPVQQLSTRFQANSLDVDTIGLIQALTGFVVVFAASAYVLLTNPGVISAILNPLLHRSNLIKSADGTKLLDGPKYAWPVGNSKHRLLESRKYSFEWDEQYGKIYRIWTGLYAEIIITTPEDVAKFYRDANTHTKTIGHRGGWLVNSVLGECVGFSKGGRWRAMRKCLDPFMANSVAVKQVPRINRAGQEFIARIGDSAINKDKSDDFILINAARTVMPFPLLETTRVLWGDMSDAEGRTLLDIGQVYLKASKKLFEDGFFRWGLGYWMHTRAEYAYTREYLRRWEAFNRQILETRRDQPELPIVQLWKHVDNRTVTKNELLQTITEATYTNLDVTAQVLVSACLFLAEDDVVRRDLLAEIDENRHDQDKYLARKDTLLHYAILEALRLQPALPFTLPEAAIVDKELGGYVLPKNTTVSTDSYGINIRNPFWGSDSRHYRPMRFKTVTPVQLLHNINLFGYGSRKCLGQYFADKQLRSLILHLFDTYEVSWQNASQADPAFKTDKSTWINMFKVEFALKERAHRGAGY